MIEQKVISRATRTKDEGTMGFHDYVTYKEDFEVFVKRVTNIVNDLQNCKIISICYPTEDKSVICYKKIKKQLPKLN